MLRPLLFFVVLALLAVSACASAEGLSRFYLDYAIVQHNLKNDAGNFDDLIELAELNADAADDIADFWSAEAKQECSRFSKETAARSALKMTPRMNKKAKEKIVKEGEKEIEQCFLSVYSNHWDEINNMVATEYASEEEKDEVDGVNRMLAQSASH